MHAFGRRRTPDLAIEIRAAASQNEASLLCFFAESPALDRERSNSPDQTDQQNIGTDQIRRAIAYFQKPDTDRRNDAGDQKAGKLGNGGNTGIADIG